MSDFYRHRDKYVNLLESGLELLGNGSVVFGLPHDFADETLLAVQVVVVKLLVEVLEHGDPLDNVEGVEVISILSRPELGKDNFEQTKSIWSSEARRA